MSDLFGHVEVSAPFKDIRNTRESVAEEKARLCQELNALLRKTPPASQIASIQQVKAFNTAHASALKTLRSKTSSRAELTSAISSIKAFHQEAT
jgi:hypothetical protein